MFLCSIGTTQAVTDTAKQKTETFSKEIYKDVKSVIASLSSSLKVGAEHVYGVLVKQQIVKSWIHTSCVILGFIMLILGLKAYKNDDEDWIADGEPTLLAVIRIIQLIMGFVFLMIGLINIDIIITGFVNPEFGAIEHILNLVK